ncbi:MAG: hypothetical protein ABEJ56_02355 [Candidatus Nanohaloarchaea archaeon]
MDNSSDIYLKEKPVMTLITIHQSDEDIFCGKVSGEIDSAYAHKVKIVSRLKEMEIIETKQVGRKKLLSLTDQGSEQAEHLINLIKVSEKNEMDMSDRIGEKEAFN